MSTILLSKLHKVFASRYCFQIRQMTAIPSEPTWSLQEYWKTSPNKVNLDIKHAVDEAGAASLEELTLTPLEKGSELEKLNTIVAVADCLQGVDTDGIDPMTTCVENREMYMRSGNENETVTKEDVLANAHEVFKDYFTAPPSEKMRGSSNLN